MRELNPKIPPGWNKDTIKMLRKAKKTPGSKLDCMRSGHWRWFAPDGKNIVTGGGTPSDRRALQASKARIRRLGGYTYIGLDQF